MRILGRIVHKLQAVNPGGGGLIRSRIAPTSASSRQGLTPKRYFSATIGADGSVDADLIITNGHVIDPANDIDEITDVAIKNNQIVAVGNNLKPKTGGTEVHHDASGCLVTPGLVDIQVHAYQYATPFGIDIDRYCLGRGVTTVVDGASSGATTFMGLRKFIAEKAKTRLYVFLNIAMHGMAAGDQGNLGKRYDIEHRAPKSSKGSHFKNKEVGGEYDSLRLVDASLATQCIKDNEDVIVGAKVRLRADACSAGKNEDDVFRIALKISSKVGKPLMTHHAESTIPTNQMTGTMGCPGSLRKGDIYSQVYQGYSSGVLDPVTHQIYPSVLNARQRGVLYDVGHGQKAFTWTVAEKCAEKNFYPDLISTNLHFDNINGPVYDLSTVMSKMLHVGMPLFDVIKAVTSNAAFAIKRQDEIGSLGVGKCADITILKEDDCEVDLEDSNGQMRRVVKRLVPIATWRNGEKQPIFPMENFPNVKHLQMLRETSGRLLIHDGVAVENREMAN